MKRTKNNVKQQAKRGNARRSRAATASLIVVMALIGLIGAPLLTVWKQVYITNASVRAERLIDSLTIMNERLARLQLATERLMSTERIERIARESLALDYPRSREIIVVRSEKDAPRPLRAPSWRFIAVLRRSLAQDKG
jgi:cell division protein FtsL